MADDERQRRAAESTSANLIVIAPPGCGKTELLALRAKQLIPRLAPNQRILALTFTKRARTNLSERLQRVLGRERFRRYVTVRNFHGHAAEIILAHGRTLQLPVDELVMPTTKTLRKALERFSNDRASNEAAAELLASTKRRPLTDDEVLCALDAAGDALAKRVEVERVKRKELHYDDLLRHGQRLLAVSEIANLYHQHYGAVLVDEFQDLSPQQLAIALSTCKTSRTFAGDPLQGIYSWAGAEPIKIESRLRGMCDPIQLTVSYRSSPAVLAMLNGVSRRMGAAPLRAFAPSAWPDGGASSVLELPTIHDEAILVASLCKQIVDADPTVSIGVITRSGWRRREIDRELAARDDIPCRRWDFAIEDPGVLDMLRVAVSRMPADVLFENARDKIISTIDPSDVDTIEQVVDAFELLSVGATGTVRSALAQFRVPREGTAIVPGVHLLNAHTGKGQQFDWVFIPGLEEKHLPDRRSSSGDALAEEERVLLVMLSRARHGVVATRAKVLEGRFGPYASIPSRWLSGLAATATMDWAALTSHLNKVYPN